MALELPPELVEAVPLPAHLAEPLLAITLTALAIIAVRKVAAPLIAIISHRISGLVKLIGTISSITVGSVMAYSTLNLTFGEAMIMAVTLGGTIALLYTPLTNMLAGDILRMTRTVREGDVISISNQLYKIQKIGEVHTLLVTPDLRYEYHPNTMFLKERILNYTKSGAGLVTVNVVVNGRSVNLSDVKLIMLKVGTDVAKSELAAGRAADVRVVSIRGDEVELQLRLYILTPTKAESLASLILERIYAKLAESASRAYVGAHARAT